MVLATFTLYWFSINYFPTFSQLSCLSLAASMLPLVLVLYAAAAQQIDIVNWYKRNRWKCQTVRMHMYVVFIWCSWGEHSIQNAEGKRMENKHTFTANKKNYWKMVYLFQWTNFTMLANVFSVHTDTKMLGIHVRRHPSEERLLEGKLFS